MLFVLDILYTLYINNTQASASTIFPYTTLFRSPPPTIKPGIPRRGCGSNPDSWQKRDRRLVRASGDRKSTRLNSSHTVISYAVFCLKKKKHQKINKGRIFIL